MKTHDFHDLAKPPFFAILLLICLVVLLASLYFFAELRLPLIQKGVTEAQPIEQNSNGVIVQQVTYTQIIIWMLPFAGLYSLIGVGLIEAVHRFLKRNV